MSNPYLQLAPSPVLPSTPSVAYIFGNAHLVVKNRLTIIVGDQEIDLVKLLARVEFLEKLTEGYPRY